MPYYKRKRGTHRRREEGRGMVAYRSGEIMWAEPWEIKPFANVFELVSDSAGRVAMRKRGLDPDEVEGRISTPLLPPEKEEEAPPPSLPPPPEVGLMLHARGGGWYDVINVATDKPINDKPMRKDKAEALVGSIVEGDGEGKGEEEKEEEVATTVEADPVDSAETVAGTDGIPLRRRAESSGQGEDTVED